MKRVLLSVLGILAIFAAIFAATTGSWLTIEKLNKERFTVRTDDVDSVSFRLTKLYDIEFANYDGKTLQKLSVQYGLLPEYTGATPHRDSTLYYVYSFREWQPSVELANRDARYTAKMDSMERRFVSLFYNSKGRLGYKLTAAGYDQYGQFNPIKNPSDKYFYTFKSWKRDTSLVTHDTLIYTPLYDSTRYYRVRFVDYDETLLKLDSTKVNTYPTPPADPQRDSTVYNVYKFSGWMPTMVIASSDASYTAMYTTSDRLYTSVFKDYNGTEVKTVTVPYDSIPNLNMSRADEDGVSFTFREWSRDTKDIAQNKLYYTAVYDTIRYRKVEFVDYDGKSLSSSSVLAGDMPTAPADPKRDSTLYKVYTFVGWTPEVAKVSADVVYTAKYDSTDRQFTIIYKNYDGSTFKSEIALYDHEVISDVPTRATTPTYVYEFSGWEKDASELLKNRIYYVAQYDSIPRYVVRFEDYNANPLKEDTLIKDDMPTAPADPKRDSTLNKVYTFVGWTPEVAKVSADVVYTAKYDSTDRQFTIIYKNYDGSTFKSEIALYDHEVISDVPTRATTPTYVYEFSGWEKDASELLKNRIYYVAQYDSIPRYVVRFEDYNANPLKEDTLIKDDMPTAPADPKRDSTLYKVYTFVGWTPEVAKVSADVVYTAKYDSTDRKFTIIYKNYDGSTFKSEPALYDHELISDVPTRATATTSYVFVGWEKDETDIAKNKIYYTAQYGAVSIKGVNGALTAGAFKISATQLVYFSQGNLQFYAGNGNTHKVADGTAKGVWRFAENQYDCVGSGNSNIAEDYAGWIDLFGWGTSGWNSGAKEYQPWSTSTERTDYTPGNVATNNLTGDYANADWGVYNAISNGGNEVGKWRTLTKDEWQYLLDNHKWANGAITDGNETHNCLLLFPIGFVIPDGISLTYYSDNNYTAEQFKLLEKNGAVALPQGGDRGGTETTGLNERGCYMSSTAKGTNDIWGLQKRGITNFYRNYGRSVRLVQDLPYTVYRYERPDGTVLCSLNVSEGMSPVYCGENPNYSDAKYSYIFTGWENPTDDHVIKATYDDYRMRGTNGALAKAFKVSETKSVYFSQGNLQFYAGVGSTPGIGETHATASGDTLAGIWRFAENQYDIIGADNANIAEDYAGWIDLFAWGTSGWEESGAKAYQPWATSTTNSDYYVGGAAANNLEGDYANADWGVYNAIANGGNVPGAWRTLSRSEWLYLFANTNWTMGKIFQGAKQIYCVFLIPDDFVAPSGVTVSGTGKGTSRTISTYASYKFGEFEVLEEAGVVALPFAWLRDPGKGINTWKNHFCYWMTTITGADRSFHTFGQVSSTSISARVSGYDEQRCFGNAVRLVQDAQ